MNWDNDKQRKTARRLLKRLGRRPMNGRQAANFMQNYSEFKDDRSYDFLDELVKKPSFPVKKKGDKLLRTDIEPEVKEV